MPSVTLKREEGESEAEYAQRLQEHEESVYHAEERLRKTREKVTERWGK